MLQGVSFIEIFNNSTVDINWVNTDYSGINLTDRIDVWRINITSNLTFLEHCMLLLNNDERERANRYYQVKDRNRFLISRGALRTILSKYLNVAPSSITFGVSPNKKPIIHDTGKVKLHYNVSHSGDWILIAVSDSDIGADVEFIKPSFQFQEILTDYFSQDEVDFINHQSSLERFFLLWTRKEAFVKATGKGLDSDLRTIPSLDGIYSATEVARSRDWFITSFTLNEQYIAAIAGNVVIKHINFMNFNF